MKDKTLLEEIKKENETKLEQEFEEKQLEEKKEEKKEKKINVFSSSTFPAVELERLKKKYQKEEDEEINKIESKVGSVIETPNYDTMESLTESEKKKVYVVSKEEPKKKTNKFLVFIISMLFAIFSIWGIINISMIDNVSSQITEVSSEYKLNLATYLRNLTLLDTTNSNNLKELIETIPDEGNPPSQIEEESNWFDRFCKFLNGLIGG